MLPPKLYIWNIIFIENGVFFEWFFIGLATLEPATASVFVLREISLFHVAGEVFKPRVLSHTMGKKGRGRGHSSSSRGRVGSPGFGRVQKKSANNAKTFAILTGIDDNKLHPLYVPRSPVRTRATTMNNGKPLQQ